MNTNNQKFTHILLKDRGVNGKTIPKNTKCIVKEDYRIGGWGHTFPEDTITYEDGTSEFHADSRDPKEFGKI